ncbi:MAG: YceI family protein [Pseudomonadota bacterium]|nr:YceI family protein [Pseudomonadota bacterium]
MTLTMLRPFALLGLLASSSAFAATYDVDATHSRVGFSVTHMMVSTVRGEFGSASGTVDWDPANVGATKVNATVGVTSIDTRDAKRDDHLRSPDFFDVAKFAEAKFVSKSVKNITAEGFDLVGDLTIHGVTKETTFKVKNLPADRKDPWGNMKTGTRATATINRQDFGVKWNTQLDGGGYVVGDEVAIELDIELARKK